MYALWEAQKGAYDHIFPTMTAGYNPGFYVDEAMHAETIVRVVGGSGKRIGIERLSAHDLRRTHITLALNSGAPLPDMQAQAGHANAATTSALCPAGRCQVKAAADRFLRTERHSGI